MITDDIDFDDWFDSFLDACLALGYDGAIGKMGTKEYYDDLNEPERAAALFVAEMNG